MYKTMCLPVVSIECSSSVSAFLAGLDLPTLEALRVYKPV